MKSIKNEITVGILFFISLAILGYFTIIMRGDLFERREYYQITVLFTNIEGLGISDKVKINGVESGIVDNVQLLESNQVLVSLKMHREFLMYENFKIKIKNETALGGKYISINPGMKDQDGKDYALVENRKNLEGESSGDIFSEITELIAENRSGINKSINNIEQITAKINTGQGTIGKLVNENKVHDNTDDLISEVRETMEDSREQAPITSFIRAALMAF